MNAVMTQDYLFRKCVFIDFEREREGAREKPCSTDSSSTTSPALGSGPPTPLVPGTTDVRAGHRQPGPPVCSRVVGTLTRFLFNSHHSCVARPRAPLAPWTRGAQMWVTPVRAGERARPQAPCRSRAYSAASCCCVQSLPEARAVAWPVPGEQVWEPPGVSSAN